ncbi:hypothetical protein [Mycoplana sp. MJR14]|uniref:hypothetical protein n=1 Tax=Mycoplana sp. MJR14 TaxID=3032583 RepID=UPI0023D9DC50|nr:hypothetical protein [Mycoplana sp. MJR14]MDF1635529.1 hypothetical protein [Mycoplana sp. MJR14]
MNTEKSFERFLMAIGALVAVGVAIHLALNDKSASASVMAALAAGFAALYFLPLIDSLEVFGLKAKLRERIDDADRLLSTIRKNAIVSAEITAAQVSWLGRKGPSWNERRLWIDAIERHLVDLGVDDREIAQIKRPVLNFLSFDLYSIFNKVVIERLQFHIKAFDKAILDRCAKHGAEDVELASMRAALSDELHALPEVWADSQIAQLEQIVQRRLGPLSLTTEEKQTLLAYAADFIRISDTVQATATLTDEALDLVRRHHENSRLWLADYSRIFPD